MAIIFRCDICNKETRTFWNIMVARKRCVGVNPPTIEKSEAFDVCSEKCEQEAVSMILLKIVPSTESKTDG